ncbi:hypothetical protein CVT25_001277 [Psilocybe cyanescens]|uniref:Hydrophobin n=1 Tax=Psilocybe cyanescens TaxID=93625 RepID=A0A409XEJ5_PSICY|nr:hypothetical protein CVT25_001277 [Psilocybe cyanescens]
MFARASTLVLALPLLAAASAVPRTDGPSNQCNTGTIQCCNTVLQSNTTSTNLILGLLGIVLSPVTGLLGLSCTPLSVLAIAGNSCTAQSVCCTGNQFMFARASTLVLALPLLAAASAVPRTDGPSNQCNTGPVQCCNTVLQSGTTSTNLILGLLGIVLGPVTGLLGLNCTPIGVLGIGGNSCTAQPVCCTGNDFNGLVNIGCSPINLNL